LPTLPRGADPSADPSSMSPSGVNQRLNTSGGDHSDANVYANDFT
jgi:hypothetical protein